MKNKKIFISVILIATMLLNLFSISAYATEIKSSLEPEQVVLVGDSKKFKEKRIRTDGIERQDIDLKVEEDISSTDLDSATNIIIDQQTYDHMDNSEKRNLNRVLMDEVENKKKITFIGDENNLNYSRLVDNLDLETSINISDLNTESKVFAISIDRDIYGDDVISFYHTNNDKICDGKSLEYLFDVEMTEFKDNVNVDKSLTDIVPQRLDSSAETYKQKIVDYNVISNNNTKEAIIRTVTTAKRVGVENPKGKKTTSTWEIKMDLDINPQNGYEISAVGASMEQGNKNDEIRLKSWPTTTQGSGSHSFSFGSDVGVSGISANAGYTYSINYTDIDCTTNALDGNIDNYYWGFTYKSGSNVSKNSSSLDVGSRYNNSKGNFTLEVASSVLCNNLRHNSGYYRFSLKDISVK